MITKDTIYKKPLIQKFKGNFKQINGGGTILFTKTIQSITNSTCLAIYVYLASKPPEWRINIKEIVSHFYDLGRNVVYRGINDLCAMGLLERKEVRTDKGKFKEYVYYLHLDPLPQIREMDYPLPGLPQADNPLPEIGETYKEKNKSLKRKESKKGLLKKPSQSDFQEYASKVKGYEWVGEWLNNQSI